MIQIKVIAVNRKKALEKGFMMDDWTTWVDILSSWLFTVGAKECAFTSDEPDEIVIFADFEKEPSDLLVGDMVMREKMKSEPPMRLDHFDPYLMRPVLAAWRRHQKMFLVEREKLTALLKGFVGQAEALIVDRPYYPPTRIEEMGDFSLKFPRQTDAYDDRNEDNRRESCGA